MSRVRVGVIVPWMNRTVEDELPALVSDQGVSLHWSRALPTVLPADRSDESYLSGLLADVPNALARLAPEDLDLLILACTSAALEGAGGTAGFRGRVVTAFECVLDALAEGNGSPVLLCTPYSTELTQLIAVALRDRGHNIEVITRVASTRAFRDIPIGEVATTIASAMTPRIGRILVSCTGLYTSALDAVLSREHGITMPTMSSVSAIAGVIRKHATMQTQHHVR